MNSRSIRLEFLTRLYFARIYKPEKAALIHQAQSEAVTATIDRLESLITNFHPNNNSTALVSICDYAR